MSFTTFKNKPVSSKVVLLEFATSVTHSFFLNEEPGIWMFKWRVEVDSDTIFGWFTAVVPNTSDYSVIFGCIDHDLTGTRKTIACGYIKRIDAGTIRFYGTNVSAVTPSPDYIDIDDGDTTTENNVALAL